MGRVSRNYIPGRSGVDSTAISNTAEGASLSAPGGACGSYNEDICKGLTRTPASRDKMGGRMIRLEGKKLLLTL